MNNTRTSRIAHKLLSRQAVHYDVVTKERLTHRQRFLALRKYSGNGNIFGSFTQLPEPSHGEETYESRQKIGPKIGINPKSQYNTPIGVYAYPVDYILKTVKGDAFNDFAGDKRYIHIFSVNGLSRTLTFDESDTDKINEFQAEVSDDFESEEYNEVEDMVLRINGYVNSTINEIPVDYWGLDDKSWWRKWLDKLEEVTGFEENPDSDISYTLMNTGGLGFYQIERILRKGRFPLEPVIESIQYNMARLKRAKTVIFPYEDQIIKLPEVQRMGTKAYIDFKNTVVLAEGQRIACDEAFAWNCTRHLSGFNPVKWTGLMRRMGLIGAVDHGTSTIHENEPTQAVFFDPSSIKVLEVIHNEVPQRIGPYRPGSESLSKWAADVEKHMVKAVSSFDLSVRQFLTMPSKMNQTDVFARLSWFQQHGREYSKYWNPEMINEIIDDINNKRKNSKADPKIIDKIVQTLKRFLR